MWQEIRAQKAAENRKRTEMVRKQREDARLKKEAEQREREAKQQEEHRRRIAAEKKKVRACRCNGDHTPVIAVVVWRGGWRVAACGGKHTVPRV